MSLPRVLLKRFCERLKPTLGYVCEHFFENDTKLHNDLGVNSSAHGLQFNNRRATLNLELLDAYYVVYI